jgi:retron-type reverse transcriptase
VATKNLKKKQLRYNEYYDMQQMFDDLYYKAKNKKNYRFYQLMDIIASKQNIELAYRSIKRNTGSATKGTDSITIKDLGVLTIDEVVSEVRSRLSNYIPGTVRRVLIPKPYSDKKRPLCIPCMWDRLIQ